MKSLGYNLGATFPPTWVDPPMIIEDDPTELQEGMVLFFHPTAKLDGAGVRMALGGNRCGSKKPCREINVCA